MMIEQCYVETIFGNIFLKPLFLKSQITRFDLTIKLKQNLNTNSWSKGCLS
ncbi:unnamed protein product [Paramecium pentaurelia]|uniref:Uncharacterized protein n=1 Tax=Paramecium pentaurelia TaxID=43138 RepID=A0A8S1VN05_9CILI|nr:unnamed protein product [Paramecium pentaurelia]